MGTVIVAQFVTLDGVVEDPDGHGGTPFGGWAMRYGPEGVAGDKFRLGTVMQDGVLLLGRRTWDQFTQLWPKRDAPFARLMNLAEKAVVTRRPLPTDLWSNSRAVEGPLEAWVAHTSATQDIAVIGSQSVARILREADLVDEYRLLTFPIWSGSGRRLFDDTVVPLSLASVEHVGPATLTIHDARP
ncbi:MAG: dihydrofolate reductase family protein [Actinobacteria bacterium]|nr:dihydrofolate reductase family protein [Actinomycetota bacterium]